MSLFGDEEYEIKQQLKIMSDDLDVTDLSVEEFAKILVGDAVKDTKIRKIKEAKIREGYTSVGQFLNDQRDETTRVKDDDPSLVYSKSKNEFYYIPDAKSDYQVLIPPRDICNIYRGNFVEEPCSITNEIPASKQQLRRKISRRIEQLSELLFETLDPRSKMIYNKIKSLTEELKSL